MQKHKINNLLNPCQQEYLGSNNFRKSAIILLHVNFHFIIMLIKIVKYCDTLVN